MNIQKLVDIFHLAYPSVLLTLLAAAILAAYLFTSTSLRAVGYGTVTLTVVIVLMLALLWFAFADKDLSDAERAKFVTIWLLSALADVGGGYAMWTTRQDKARLAFEQLANE